MSAWDGIRSLSEGSGKACHPEGYAVARCACCHCLVTEGCTTANSQASFKPDGRDEDNGVGDDTRDDEMMAAAVMVMDFPRHKREVPV